MQTKKRKMFKEVSELKKNAMFIGLTPLQSTFASAILLAESNEQKVFRPMNKAINRLLSFGGATPPQFKGAALEHRGRVGPRRP